MVIRLATTSNLPKTVQSLVFVLPKKEFYEKHPFFRVLGVKDRNHIKKVLKSDTNWGEKRVIAVSLPSNPARKAILMGRMNDTSFNGRRRQVALRKALQSGKETKAKELAVFLGDFTLAEMSDEVSVRTAAENLLMADFVFNKYKEQPKGGWPEVKTVYVVVPKIEKSLEAALKEGIIVGGEVNHCRVLSNTPGGDMTPQKLAEAAVAEGKSSKSLKVKVLEEKEMQRLGMGGVLGVSRGSDEKPRFIIMEYWGTDKKEKPLVFVGKGVTFDTGGLNLKPSDGIYEMHMDMSGGSAVIHAMSAIARLKLPVNVVGLVPAVENMPSGSSYRPGDVLKAITGKTIEVLNTDAEGRVILADALGYAHRYKPQIMVDVATLTGAAISALGQRVSALFTNDDKLESMARLIGERSGDEVWPLPLWEEHNEEVQGTFADVSNVGKTRYGGAISGAAFLKQFVGDYPWIHLDIAPTMTTIEGQYLSKGASGVGVRFLTELARKYSKK